jgi:hypothetical protein
MIPHLLLFVFLSLRGGLYPYGAPPLSEIETEYATQISILADTLESATLGNVMSESLWKSVGFSTNYDHHNLLRADVFLRKPKGGGRGVTLVHRISPSTRIDVSPISTGTNRAVARVIMYRDQSTKKWIPAAWYHRVVKTENGNEFGFEFIMHIDTIRKSEQKPAPVL